MYTKLHKIITYFLNAQLTAFIKCLFKKKDSYSTFYKEEVLFLHWCVQNFLPEARPKDVRHVKLTWNDCVICSYYQVLFLDSFKSNDVFADADVGCKLLEGARKKKRIEISNLIDSSFVSR